MPKEVDVDELHPEKRDKVTGFKSTPSERKEIEEHCKKLGVSLSRYIRHVVFNDIRGTSDEKKK